MKLNKYVGVVAVGGLMLCSVATFAADSSLKTDDQKFSYMIGLQIGENLKNQGIENIDVKALGLAIDDVMKAHKFRLTPEEMKAVAEAARKKMMAAREVEATKAKEAGTKFLAENKTKAGVKTLPSGIQYKVLKEGSGAKPTLDDSVTVNYSGSLLNGTEFDSSYKRGQPATFAVNSIIEGWKQVLPLMKVGSKWQVVIPSELAYGERGAGSKIGPNETLVFEIELLGIEPKK